MGAERKSAVVTEKSRRLTAYHVTIQSIVVHVPCLQDRDGS
jgi:ATP-dependent Zn protease